MLFDPSPTQIIMVTYHRPNDFSNCIQSILDNTNCPFHLSIIDNSMGHIDSYLNEYRDLPNVTIYANDTNIGKGASVNKWYPTVMIHNQLAHFVSIDADIVVSEGWLTELIRSFYYLKQATKVAMIAPAICNHDYQTWDYQTSNQMVMHNPIHLNPVFDYYPGLYHNRHTAGPLFIIDTRFFESTGMFYDKQLYGADDGILCARAYRHNAFVGINSNVMVKHLNIDSDDEYIAWKKRNITKDVDLHGRWD